MRKLVQYIIAISVLLFVGCSENKKSEVTAFSFSGNTMGTSYNIKVVKDSVFTKNNYDKIIKSGVDSLLLNVNRKMSTYIPDSELSMFNSSADTTWFPISKEFAEVVKAAIFIGDTTNNSLDITVGPLVNLWGFGPTTETNTVPDSQEVQLMKSLTGLEKIRVQFDPPAIRKAIPEMYVDLSSIAKGYGVDKVSEYLLKLGLNNFMVEIGGEVRANGKNQNNEYWRIGISTPDNSGNIEKVVQLNNQSMATSGDYHNYFMKNGKRYSHTIDPRTGYPITHNLASVSVITKTCMMADGYATALDVLGPGKGMLYADTLKLPVFMIVHKNGNFTEEKNGLFEKYLFKKERIK